MMPAMMVLDCLAMFATVLAALPQEREARAPVPCGHAHNDYAHERPLLDALDHGFGSVEADVFLVEGELRVGHTPLELRGGRTIEALYLDPLWRRFQSEGGVLLPNGMPLQLLVDFKSEAGSTWRALRQTLARYRPMLTTVREGVVHHGALSVVISGNRPLAALRAEGERLARLDGRPSELGEDLPPQLCPLVSERWSKLFSWRGKGEMPDEERGRLRSLVDACHRGGQTLRFWAAPQTPALWREMLAAGADWLHADDLGALSRWMRAEGAELFARRGARRLSPRGAGASAGVTAHRGYSSAYPENTLIAFERALELGVDWLECDVYRTLDGVLVVTHDARTGRVGERDVAVAETRYEDLARIDVAHGFRCEHGATRESVPPARIPRLREVIELVLKARRARLSIQPKQDIVDAIIALIRELGAEPWVGFNEGSLARVRRVKELAPEIPVFFDTDGIHTVDHLRAALLHGFEGVVMHHPAITAEDVQLLHACGIEAGAWTVNDEKEMRRLLDLGIDRIYTDRPGVLKKLRR